MCKLGMATAPSGTGSKSRNVCTSVVCPILDEALTRDLSVLQARLPPEVNRVLYVRCAPSFVATLALCLPLELIHHLLFVVRNLPFNITADEMFDIFGKYGAIRQIRV